MNVFRFANEDDFMAHVDAVEARGEYLAKGDIYVIDDSNDIGIVVGNHSLVPVSLDETFTGDTLFHCLRPGVDFASLDSGEYLPSYRKAVSFIARA